jgi:DinB family protein
MERERYMRSELISLLSGGNAHDSWKTKLASWPEARINLPLPGGKTPNALPLTPWAILEHMRICQLDILEFIRDPEYASPDYPYGYWPAAGEPADRTDWEESLRLFGADFQALIELAENPGSDLFAPLPHAPDYTLFRELLLAADHNSYHLGQLGLFEDLG